MIVVIIAIHLILVLGLIAVILLQKSEGGGLVSSTSGFMTGRGTANVLTRTTAFLAIGFFLTSLVLSIIASHERKPTTVIPASQSAPAVPGPAAPAPGGGGVLDKLQGPAPAAPAAPAAPTGPQVPPSK